MTGLDQALLLGWIKSVRDRTVTFGFGAEGHARPEQQTLVEKVSLVLWSYKHVYPGKILIRNDAVASHYLCTLLQGEGWEVPDCGICSFWLYSASKACGETICCCIFSTVKWQQLQALLLLYRQHGYVSLKLVLPQYQQRQLWQVRQHWRQQGG